MAQKVSSPLKVGASVFVRTVTFHYTGKVVQLTDQEIVLDDAAWIADSGRWSAALATGSLNEVEPYPGIVSIARTAVVDVTSWAHPLPRTVK